MIFANILLLLAGFAALVKGADLFVGGASALARRFHVPSLVIGAVGLLPVGPLGGRHAHGVRRAGRGHRRRVAVGVGER